MTVGKYVLFASSSLQNGDSKPPCAFFLSDKGCRNGDNCKFSHSNPNAVDNSVVSSESSGGEEEEEETKPPPPHPSSSVSASSTSSSKRRKPTGDVFAKPKTKKQKESPKEGPASKMERSVKTAKEVFETLKHPPKSQKQQQQQLPSPKTQNSPASAKPQKPTPKSKQVSPGLAKIVNTSNFRSLNLPIASFTMGQPPKGAKTESMSDESAQEEDSIDEGILPTSTEVGRKWLPLVRETRKHPRYNTFYNLQKFKDADVEAGFSSSMWVQTPPFDESKAKNPQAIAIDCEMCETQDPVSGNKNPRALCRISVVDTETDEVLLDTLVKPAWPVSDYRTWINGISSGHLENVQFTLRHAQAFLMALCSEETVMMGHGLNNDLAAMRIEHPTVVDSACLYKLEDREHQFVSLKHLAKTILDVDMPKKHDSVNDARLAFQCLEYYREKEGKVDPIKPAIGSACKLFVHRIPKKVNTKNLSAMFAAHSDVTPTAIEDIVFSGDLGKTYVVFPDKQTCDTVFDKLDQPADADASGRLQKKVYLRDRSYIRVRKMVLEKADGKSSATNGKKRFRR